MVCGEAYGEGEIEEASVIRTSLQFYCRMLARPGRTKSFRCEIFTITQNAVEYLQPSRGWEVGVGPAVAVVDKGLTKNLLTSRLKAEADAFMSSQQRLMAGVALE